MTIPTIHLNGTSKKELIDGLEEAWYALDAAYQKLKRIAPNGRDYYPQGPGALNAATQEHLDRLHKIDEVKEELSRLMCGISDQ